MRVLHVIEAGPPVLREFARPRTELSFDVRALACRLIMADAPGDHRACLIGNRRALHRLRDLGVRADYVVPTLLGRSALSIGPMGRLLRAVRPDFVHVWNGCWTGGCAGRPGRAWRLEGVAGATHMGLPFWMSSPRAFACGPVEERRARDLGVECVPVDAPTLGGMCPPRTGHAREAIRIVLLGPHADSRRFVFLCTLMGEIGVPVVPIVADACDSMRRTRHFYRQVDRPLRAEVTSRPIIAVIPSCDVALWMGGPRGPCAASVSTAMAAGVPVIVPPEGAWAIPTSLHPHLVARNATSAELARLVQMCAENRWRLSGLVRAAFALTNDGFVGPVRRSYSGSHLVPGASSGPETARCVARGAVA